MRTPLWIKKDAVEQWNRSENGLRFSWPFSSCHCSVKGDGWGCWNGQDPLKHNPHGARVSARALSNSQSFRPENDCYQKGCVHLCLSADSCNLLSVLTTNGYVIVEQGTGSGTRKNRSKYNQSVTETQLGGCWCLLGVWSDPEQKLNRPFQHTCTHTNMHPCTCTHTHMHTTHKCVLISSAHIYKCALMYMHIHTCIYIHTNMQPHTGRNTHMCTHAYKGEMLCKS